ncbi:MAG TPA: DNA polymerase III subunit delta [Bacteroidales bacterium]|nr:DNA polymerase III subunit delta [Bacteroidales bacterium]HPS16813.1 DNA polymerase III subunit delta [Bacteroidales bacterium]
MQFSKVVGQEHVKKRLIRSVKENRVSHAQLFLGPEGSGKLALAIAYAQYLCCEDKKENDSCGVCRSCIKFQKLAHPDLHFVFPISATRDKPYSASYMSDWRELLLEQECYLGVEDWYRAIGLETKQGIINADECNEIIKTLGLKTYESEYKIMIIWMVEKLYHKAAPKLLKILEEPPDKTLFLLICEDHEQVINTIISRTQIIKIPRIENKDMVPALIEKYKLTPKRAHEISHIVEGNYIEAARLSNDGLDDFNFVKLRDWMRSCYKENISELLKFSEEIGRIGREKQKEFLINTLRLFREIMLFSAGTKELIKIEGEEYAFAQGFSPFFNDKNKEQIISEINDAVYHVERNANARILFLDLSLKMAELIKIKA